ncbi:hypothetical protein ABZ819_22370 [Streptomyces venezuelae]|uniref:hypothetical protein n=1 Tax=Streptomyces venezuelae TaxID=54571 RepID=UPI003435F3E5
MRAWQEWAAAVRLLWRAGPRHTVALTVTVVCGALTGPLVEIATGRLVGGLPGAVTGGPGSTEARRVLAALTVFGALILVRTGLRAVEGGLAAVLKLRAASIVEDRAMAAGTGPDGIGHLEEPGYADTLRLVTEPNSRPDQLATLLPEIVRPRLEGIGLLVLLAPLAWWAPVLLALAAVLTYRSYQRLARHVHGSTQAASAVIRRAGYLRSLAVDPEPAKEARLFGLRDWLAERMTAVWQSGMAEVWATRGTAARRACGAVGFVVLVEAAVLGHAAFAAARGDLDLTRLRGQVRHRGLDAEQLAVRLGTVGALQPVADESGDRDGATPHVAADGDRAALRGLAGERLPQLDGVRHLAEAQTRAVEPVVVQPAVPRRRLLGEGARREDLAHPGQYPRGVATASSTPICAAHTATSAPSRPPSCCGVSSTRWVRRGRTRAAPRTRPPPTAPCSPNGAS